MFLEVKKKITSTLLILSIFFTFPIYSTTVSYPSISIASIKKEFGRSITAFLSDRGFPGAIVSIYQGGQELINECFGICEDTDKAYPLASVSKLFTEAAVNQLIENDVVTRDTKVLEYLEINFPVKDSRVKQITVGQLLDHTGGWDREITEDPLFAFDRLPKSINSNEDLLKFVLKTYRLDHQPGTYESYSNFGYFLLGQVIEKATGQKYLDYLNDKFAHPNHIELYQAKTPQAYSEEYPYDNFFKLELATSTFGLAAKMSDIGYFFSKFDRHGFETASPKFMSDWWKDGSLPGMVTSLVRKRDNDVAVVVFIPTRDEENWMEDNTILTELVDMTANHLGL